MLAAVRPIADELARDWGLVVWDVEFLREAGRETLRVSLDRPGGVGADELSRYSESLSRELDAVDAVPGEGRYVLEVTSPGAERKLRTPEEFRLCRGRNARVTFSDGRPPLEGTIVDADDEAAELDGPDGATRVGFEEMSQARLKIPGVF